jgi:hypothetical protein
LTLLAVFAIGLAFAWFAITPERTVDSLYDAVRAGDSERIERLVDFDLLRQNLKTDVRDYATRRASTSASPLAGIGAAIGSALADGLVDTFVSPAGLTTLLRGQVPGQGDSGEMPPESPEYDIDRRGLSRFDAHVRDEQATEPVLVFTRTGLRWRLTRILLRTESSD